MKLYLHCELFDSNCVGSVFCGDYEIDNSSISCKHRGFIIEEKYIITERLKGDNNGT